MPETSSASPSTSLSRPAATAALCSTPLLADTVSVLSSVVVPTSARATGPSLRGFTVTLTVAVSATPPEATV